MKTTFILFFVFGWFIFNYNSHRKKQRKSFEILVTQKKKKNYTFSYLIFEKVKQKNIILRKTHTQIIEKLKLNFSLFLIFNSSVCHDGVFDLWNLNTQKKKKVFSKKREEEHIHTENTQREKK